MPKIKLISPWILAALFASILLVSHSLGGSAATLSPSTPPLPDQVYGLVRINDVFVPQGTLVSAWCDGVKFAEFATIIDNGESWYTLGIPGDDPSTTSTKEGCAVNETVSFKISADLTPQQKNWSEGNSSQLDLSLTKISKVYIPVVRK
jgi:hypothetical protein